MLGRSPSASNESFKEVFDLNKRTYVAQVGGGAAPFTANRIVVPKNCTLVGVQATILSLASGVPFIITLGLTDESADVQTQLSNAVLAAFRTGTLDTVLVTPVIPLKIPLNAGQGIFIKGLQTDQGYLTVIVEE